MKESFESSRKQFTFPDIDREHGEFTRVGETYGIDSSVLQFLAREGALVTLDADVWQKLDNTDANEIAAGARTTVHTRAESVGRNWDDVREKLATGIPLDAPIVMKYGHHYHLVAGNTRLMVARAARVNPTVLLFEVESPN